MKRHIRSSVEQTRVTETLKRLQDRADLIRSELHRLGAVEFTRRYQTGPLKPAHISNF